MAQKKRVILAEDGDEKVERSARNRPPGKRNLRSWTRRTTGLTRHQRRLVKWWNRLTKK